MCSKCSPFLAGHWLRVIAVLLFITTATSHRKAPDCIRVRPHESIQNAIDHARPGDRIELEGGTYNEQLTINKSGIHLIGKDGATLRPPATTYTNLCSGLSQTPENKSTEAGICIHGTVVLQNYVTEHRQLASPVTSFVDNISIRGLTIDGFNGENIAILGGRNTRIKANKLINAGQYGILSVGSKQTRITRNTISTTKLDFIGISIDDTADSVISHNNVTGYFTAYVSETNGGIITNNIATNICVGAAADPGVKGSIITANSVSFRNPACNVLYPQFGAGVVVFGASQTRVEGNTIEKINNGGFGVGIFLLPGTNGEPAEGNVVKGNVLRENDFDIFDNSNRTNSLSGNKCLSTGNQSVPVTACA